MSNKEPSVTPEVCAVVNRSRGSRDSSPAQRELASAYTSNGQREVSVALQGAARHVSRASVSEKSTCNKIELGETTQKDNAIAHAPGPRASTRVNQPRAIEIVVEIPLAGGSGVRKRGSAQRKDSDTATAKGKRRNAASAAEVNEVRPRETRSQNAQLPSSGRSDSDVTSEPATPVKKTAKAATPQEEQVPEAEAKAQNDPVNAWTVWPEAPAPSYAGNDARKEGARASSSN